MVEFTDTFFYKIRFLATGLLIVACLLLLPFLPHLLWINPPAQAADTQPAVINGNSLDGSPNAITRGMFKGADGLERLASSAEQTVGRTFQAATGSVVSATVKGGKSVVHAVGR